VAESKPISPVDSPAQDADALWTRVLEVASSSMRLDGMLAPSRLVELTDDHATLDVTAIGRALAEQNLSKIEQVFTRAAGRTMRVTLTVQHRPQTTEQPEPARTLVTGARLLDADAERRAREHPLVKAAVEAFDATVVRVQPRAATTQN